ncbi:alkylation response protein AidB-like acyl-CoA dehydrogenase [Scopulibacillus daqui]|uniref:Alkylation response protein AidB-like acyl-CoA dehydrogenase n=1 Tax=Scopulibacillus daqui TaxID=1469162 RepID=A0ABS2Q134_9BACL|nr:acyl-CoA dehydrogenase [Scopulibacillus daqui]MBM7645394.1 alkylation response protein AidB-like acyl-CoA dehydrogenase [Scopulibacillus daqui]
MDLLFTKEQEMMRKMVKDFAEKEIAPFVDKMEEEDIFPLDIVKKMGSLGLLGIPIPEAYGGSGMDFISYIIAIHELSKVSPTIGVIMSVHTSVGTNPILYFGSKEQKETYIPKLASGEYIGAFAVTEPGSGSDVSGLKTKAVRNGDHYLLNGSKAFITNGEAADTFVTFAKTDPEKGKDGITAFIVKKGTEGFSIGKKEKKMGLNGSSTVSLNFDHANVPKKDRLGEEGQGLKIALGNLNVGRIGIAAQALGIAEGAYSHAAAYAKSREQFGQSIGKQQAIGFKLADMAANIEAAKLLVYQASYLVQTGKPCRKEASMAKLFASRTAVQTAIEAVQIFGGYGYTKDYPVERYFRDAKVTEIYEGTSEIQHLVISKQLLS